MVVLLLPSFLVIFGLVLLVVGGELLIRAAVELASSLRISPLVIGLTVVAFGTSAPELAVSLQSAWQGQADLAIGNVVGSNIANVLLILGLSASVAPLLVASQLVRLDVPLVIVASLLLLLLGLDEKIGRIDGLILFGCLSGYTVWLVRNSRKESKQVEEEFEEQISAGKSSTMSRTMLNLGIFLLGLLLLGVGSRLLIHGAVEIARLAGVGELIIGLTVVAIGTSLPELVTSIVASMKGQRDIAVGNIVGSNLFNILCVLGLSSIFSPRGINVPAEALRFDIPVMIAVAFACLPVFAIGNKIARWEGGLFFAYYVAYNLYIVMAATQENVSRNLSTVMFAFVIPLTSITLLVWLGRVLRKSSDPTESA